MKVRASLVWDNVVLGDPIELEIPGDAFDGIDREPMRVLVPLAERGVEQLRKGAERAKARGMDCGPGGPFIPATRLGVILEVPA